MKLTYFGHATFALEFAGLKVVTDPCSIGYPIKPLCADVVTESHQHHDHNDISGMQVGRVLSAPGEYEVGGVKFSTISTFHDPQGGALRGENLIFVIEAEGLKIAHLGDLGHVSGADALENVDVLMIPIGGYYTIDTDEAMEIVRRLKPRIVIPMHFKTDCIDYPIETVDRFAALSGAAAMPTCQIEIAADTLSDMPAAIVLPYCQTEAFA